MKKMALVALVGLTLCTQEVWAARTPVHEAAESPQYGRKFGGMVGRGLLNVATCFVDLLVNVVNETRQGPPFVGTLVGVAKGAGCTVLRAGSGVVDVATFWVPGFNGFPVSDSYDNCLAFAPAQPAVAEPMYHERPKAMEPPPVYTPPASPPAEMPKKQEKPHYTK